MAWELWNIIWLTFSIGRRTDAVFTTISRNAQVWLRSYKNHDNSCRFRYSMQSFFTYINWGHETHICVNKLTTIGANNGSSPGRRQAIIWTNAGIVLMRSLGTNFSEIWREIHTFSFKKMRLKMSFENGDHFVSASMGSCTDTFYFSYIDSRHFVTNSISPRHKVSVMDIFLSRWQFTLLPQ